MHKTIRISQPLSKTNPNANNTTTTLTPNYQLQIKKINAADDIMLKSANKRVPVKIVEYDNHSNSEETLCAIEHLITQNKINFMLPPQNTALNLAIGPTFNKHSYPQLALTAMTDRANDLAKR